jgi:hypothetical protein
MEQLPAEVLREEVLKRCADYIPVLREVCRAWRMAIVTFPAIVAKGALANVAKRCEMSLLEWVCARVKVAKACWQANVILLAATRIDCLWLCEKAREWGAGSYNKMLRAAASAGSLPLCEKAREWGADNYNKMLYAAASAGSLPLCEKAREWGADDYNWMLYGAAKVSNLPLCEKAREWGASSYDGMLQAATLAGDLRLCDKAREWACEEKR